MNIEPTQQHICSKQLPQACTTFRKIEKTLHDFREKNVYKKPEITG